MAAAPEELADRVEMWLVSEWLAAQRPEGAASLTSIPRLRRALGLADDPRTTLALMAALGELERRGSVAVGWPDGVAAGRLELRLAPAVRGDADRLFGR